MLQRVFGLVRRQARGAIAGLAALILLAGTPDTGLAQADEDGKSGDTSALAVFQASCQTLHQHLSGGDVLYACDAGRDQCDVLRGGALGFCSGVDLQNIHPALEDPLELDVVLNTNLFGSILGTDPDANSTPPFTNTICQAFGTPGTAPRTGPPSGRVLPAGAAKVCRRVEPGSGGDCRSINGSFCPSGAQTFIKTVYDANACAAIRQVLQSTISANPDPAFALFLRSSDAGRAGAEVLFVCDTLNSGPFQMRIVSPANLCSEDDPSDCLTSARVVHRLPTNVANTPACFSYRGSTICR